MFSSLSILDSLKNVTVSTDIQWKSPLEKSILNSLLCKASNVSKRETNKEQSLIFIAFDTSRRKSCDVMEVMALLSELQTQMVP